ncbi:ribokinase [Microbacterium sp. A93]|uniref:ribokinase n=1 Tax=Microbacterium sp. A93 TaxID=3450716 RepID=UPI003F42186C
MNGTVIVAGSTNFDRTLRVSSLPAEGETVLADAYAESLGGKGANQASASSLTGAPTVFATCLGADPAAAQLRRWLADFPMRVELQPLTGATGALSGQAWIHADTTGTNFITVLAGVNSALSGGFVESVLDAELAHATHLVLQGENSVQMLERSIAAARDRGVATILNLAPPLPLGADVFRQLDTLIVNEHEAMHIVRDLGLSTQDHRALFDSLEVNRLIVTLGSRGAVLYSREEDVVRVHAPSVDVIDSAGAGDALVGVYAGGLALGQPPADALRHAVAAASDSTRRPGASESYQAHTFRIEEGRGARTNGGVR